MPPYVRTVLLVDDDQDDRELISDTMAEIDPDLDVVHAEDGVKAIEYLSRFKLVALPCLIILDINMPRMNGKQTLEKIKNDEVLNAVPVVVFSTSSNPLDYKYFEQYEVAMITKPSDEISMKKDVKRLLQFCVTW